MQSGIQRNPKSVSGHKGLARKLIAAFLVLLLPILWRIPASARYYCYGAIRELVKIYVVIGSWNMSKLTSEHFFVKYRPGDRAEAELVLETAEKFYQPITEDFGYRPRGRVPIILYSTKQELNQSFGWDASESAMGVYWAGVIRVLSPGAWVAETEASRVREVFVTSGPMAHELTHLMVDYLTGGNYPRWFTEGVAQYEEYKLTGFILSKPEDLLEPPLYSMEELSRDFDNLADQTRAYSQSLAVVQYIVSQYGEEALAGLIKELGFGCSFSQAAEKVLQLDEAQFEARWQAWVLSQREVSRGRHLF
ncbi:MAG TPA: peptidase MA family metallohydrolase [Bacillota bacterium]|jgi:hypothetical protein|nr:peptidase MA family metallohydrolase [Peptococcaceae bacterium MAG4]NLW37697.1 hypothetical protein [Peptococcaceae bacterium]HPZ42764.1 peptidase MA family metallohydrolase [Bacillota bacterium]HQD75445.1 peptidase MA family metallohydrolase [Bacillota bacterium]HUM59117.1 peptidase MA family metallohydrolase [Bacillota bacterium]